MVSHTSLNEPKYQKLEIGVFHNLGIFHFMVMCLQVPTSDYGNSILVVAKQNPYRNTSLLNPFCVFARVQCVLQPKIFHDMAQAPQMTTRNSKFNARNDVNKSIPCLVCKNWLGILIHVRNMFNPKLNL